MEAEDGSNPGSPEKHSTDRSCPRRTSPSVLQSKDSKISSGEGNHRREEARRNQQSWTLWSRHTKIFQASAETNLIRNPYKIEVDTKSKTIPLSPARETNSNQRKGNPNRREEWENENRKPASRIQQQQPTEEAGSSGDFYRRSAAADSADRSLSSATQGWRRSAAVFRRTREGSGRALKPEQNPRSGGSVGFAFKWRCGALINSAQLP